MVEKMINDIYNFLDKKKVLILGYGREGKSTFDFIRERFKDMKISILDYDPITIQNDENVEIFCDTKYEKYFESFDVIIKSPGVSIKKNVYEKYKDKITSQTNLFMKYSKNLIIGVTGTKGKSTTSSLICHILKNNQVDSKLVGNIGIPILSEINDIKDSTVLVLEMSSHQLQYIDNSPQIAVLLNIYEEHLDYYESFNEYICAKENIYKFQKESDLLIYNSSCDNINKENILKLKQRKLPVYINANDIMEDNYININKDKITYCINKVQKIIKTKDIKTKLKGEHNLYNIVVAISVALEMKIQLKDILKAVASFKGLENRIEFVGKFKGINYYNDSIATIPEATICAIKSFSKVDTVIIGGKDRGVNYLELVNYLNNSNVSKILLIADSGKRIFDSLEKNHKNNNYEYVETLDNAVKIAKKSTPRNGICLLSPAAASYGYYKNFEERGNVFKELAKSK